MKFPADSNVLVGLYKADDAGVYKISEDLAIIQTVDFFTPIVDDPYWFGQIAASNAFIDIYAMGGIPKTAMNIVGFPAKQMDISVLNDILRGGLDKMEDAGVVLIGGHSVEDNELKYGLSVTGFIHPDHIITKKNLAIGDHLILTKPLGTGIINTAIKGGLASDSAIRYITSLMATLNQDAARIMLKYPVHACTDITGFGLIGHMAEMVCDSDCGVIVFSKDLPIIPEALEYAKMGLIPAGAYKNREFRESMVEIDNSVNQQVIDVIFDPQTSGGLLISVSKEASKELVFELRKNKISAVVIAEVADKPAGRIKII